MINLIETLFGLGLVAGGVAVFYRLRGARPAAWRAALLALACLALAALLELYVRARG